jgi:hypothetical protein
MTLGGEQEICPHDRSHERGTALIVALLVMVVMTLLGIPFLLMGETENRIAENERLSLQALYAAESGARVVKRWFDHPGQAANVSNPPLAAVHRTSRMIDDDGDPDTAAVAADGTDEHPYYKQDDDALFDKPYRGDLVNSLVGTEDGPDIRIDAADSTDAEEFLGQLSKALFAGVPSAVRRVAIRRIDVYAPPVLEDDGEWIRYGVGTAKVTAGVYQQQPDGSERTLAERVVRFVFNEVPYNNENLGAMHTCHNLEFPGDMKAHWGFIAAMNDVELEDDHRSLPASLARAPGLPTSMKEQNLWTGTDPGDFDDYKAQIDGERIDDPWIRVIAGEDLDKSDSGSAAQPWVFDWTPGDGALGDMQLTYHANPDAPPANRGSISYLYQNAEIGCPEYSYERWKKIAQSGGPGIRYFAWVDDDIYSEDGTGEPLTFREITNNQSGLYFFDTRDGNRPSYSDDNLTPDIHLVGGDWSFRGFLFLNTELFQAEGGVTGRTIQFQAPGEPFVDENGNGGYDSGEPYINISYPGTLDGDFVADASDDYGNPGGEAVWNARGPVVEGEAHVWGILYNTGFMDSTGDLVFYGSAIADKGFSDCDSVSGTPEAYWDQTLVESTWPPPELGLPRVMVTRWETGL